MQMAGNSFGSICTITTFGESHGAGIGVVIDGLPPGITISEEMIQLDLNRRRPGRSGVTTPRKEADQVKILSGIFEGKSTGSPIALFIENSNQKSGDYAKLKELFRPGHADFTYHKKYGNRDYRGGGRSSGRETAARVAAGAVAKELLKQQGVNITAWTHGAAGINCNSVTLDAIEQNSMRAADPEAARKMEERILELARQGESAGGIVACRIEGVPPGWGEPLYDKLDARLAYAVMGLGAVKGVEFGSGFTCAEKTGSENNDQMSSSGFLSNHAGGVLGGISTGQPIEFRIAVKPTPSISQTQNSITQWGEDTLIEIEGRHDPCICPRIVPVVEAMAAIVLADFYLLARRYGI